MTNQVTLHDEALLYNFETARHFWFDLVVSRSASAFLLIIAQVSFVFFNILDKIPAYLQNVSTQSCRRSLIAHYFMYFCF